MSRPATLLLLGAALLGGCRSATGPSTAGLRVSISAPRAAVVQGDTLRFTVAVHNLAPRSVAVTGSGSCLVAFRVLDPGGRVVAASDRVCTLDLQSRRIPARGSLVRTFLWRGDQASGAAPLERVAPGTYDVVGVLNAGEGPRVSPPVSIRLEAR